MGASGDVQTDEVEYQADTNAASPNLSIYHDIDLAGAAAPLVVVKWESGFATHSVAFNNDTSGQAIYRKEGGGPTEVWYRFGGKEIGYVGNNGSRDTDYAASIDLRTATQGTGLYFNGASTPVEYANFDIGVARLTSYDQGSSAGVYTVQSGDTLASIAASMWGDASLWYKLAQANGMSANAALAPGQTLIIPAGINRATNSATTFNPYDPNDILGNLAPTRVKPPNRKDGCGVVGMVIMVAIAAVVAWQLAPKLIALFAGEGATSAGAGAALAKGVAFAKYGAAAIEGSALAGAAGSAVSQVAGIMMGVQEKFSWNAVALAAIGSGLGVTGNLGIERGGWAGAAERGALSNAITQGVGRMTGLQHAFSWSGVAAAAVGSSLQAKMGAGGGLSDSVQRVTAFDMADAATRSLIDGSDFGDNMLAALPDALGGEIASWATGALSYRPTTINGSEGSDTLIGEDSAPFGCDDNVLGWLNDRWNGFLGGVSDLLGMGPGHVPYAGAAGAMQTVDDFAPPDEDEIIIRATPEMQQALASMANTFWFVDAQRPAQELITRSTRYLRGWGDGLHMDLGSVLTLDPFYGEEYAYVYPAESREQANGRMDGAFAGQIGMLVLGARAGAAEEPIVAEPTVEGGFGSYTSTIKWGIRDVNVRRSGPGFWGERIPQSDAAVDAYELQINPKNESYYLPHPNGGYVQFENLVGHTLQDGKLIMSPSSIYMVEDLPPFAQQAVLREATRQVEAASSNGLNVEWLVSDQKAANQLGALFRSQSTPVPITVTYRAAR